MKLKVFVPLITPEINLPDCIPFLYPFYNKSKPESVKISQYGNWFFNIEMVGTTELCDIIILPYNICWYYKHKKYAFLKEINNLSVKYGRLIICATKGDIEITPRFKNFHIYRMGGYLSKNKGNQFAYPVFIQDPVNSIYKEGLTFHEKKTPKPVVGFCGQARGNTIKWAVDTGRGIYRRLLKLANQWPYDNEKLVSTTVKRSKILDLLEKSPLVQTNFIRHTKYRGGVNTNAEKEKNTKMFFTNMQESQYIICYRGAGNYSVRLYETMASGRIPVIVTSDNNLPLMQEVNWNIFPVIDEKKSAGIAEYIATFHSSLTDAQFLFLQQEARRIWEEYLTYKSFMARWLNKYIQLLKH